MPSPSRRAPGYVPKFAGKAWDSVTGWLLDDALRRLQDGYAGVPGGFFGNPATIVQAGVAAGAGTLAGGWAAADHNHDIETGVPGSPTGKTPNEGSSTALMRADAIVTQGIVTARGDLLTHDGATAERLPVGSDDTILVADSGQATGLLWATIADLVARLAYAGMPAWTKYTFTHTQLQAAALANDIQLFSLPAAGVIHGVKIKHSTLFAGTGITDYKLSVGIVGNLVKYSPLFDVDTAVTNVNQRVSSIVDTENHGAATSIRLAATSTGANLSLSTAGAVEVWVMTSVAA